MRLQLERSSLRSKVAQRIFLLFVLCALVPIGALAILSFRQVTGQLRQQNEGYLEQASKSEGMAMLERMGMLDASVQVAALQIKAGEFTALGSEFRDRFQGMALQSDRGPSRPLFGIVSTVRGLGDEERQHLGSGKALLLRVPCQIAETVCLQMLRLIDVRSFTVLVAEIRPDYLWQAENLPPRLRLSV